jgi:hypothetical protein
MVFAIWKCHFGRGVSTEIIELGAEELKGTMRIAPVGPEQRTPLSFLVRVQLARRFPSQHGREFRKRIPTRGGTQKTHADGVKRRSRAKAHVFIGLPTQRCGWKPRPFKAGSTDCRGARQQRDFGRRTAGAAVPTWALIADRRRLTASLYRTAPDAAPDRSLQ